MWRLSTMSPKAISVPGVRCSSARASEYASPVDAKSELSTKRAAGTSTASARWPRTTVTLRQPNAAKSSSRRARIGRPWTLSMALGARAVSPPKSAPSPAASTMADSDSRAGR